MSAYYNENDPKTAAWLRELIKAGLIADGEVDERSIELVQPGDLHGFVQCHFFAGIGGWSYALRLAEWPDDRHVWTGSCPCQPFSSAGKGDGADDSRHLWPSWFRLIRECRPSAIFGEQVASSDGLGWYDRVSTDLEAENYAIGASDLCAACVGAFHIRQRLWFVAHSVRAACERRAGSVSGAQAASGGAWDSDGRGAYGSANGCEADELADTQGERGQRLPAEERTCISDGARNGEISLLADAMRRDQRRHTREPRDETSACSGEAWSADGHAARSAGGLGYAESEQVGRAGQSRENFWRDCDWLPCRDGKARPVEPGTFPLAHGIPARVGRLRGYGNAIVPQVAAEFIGAYLDVTGAASSAQSGEIQEASGE